jgi:hypothetical protein
MAIGKPRSTVVRDRRERHDCGGSAWLQGESPAGLDRLHGELGGVSGACVGICSSDSFVATK